MLEQFKPFVKGLVNEDVVLAYKAMHFGKVVYLNDKLFYIKFTKAQFLTCHINTKKTGIKL